MSTSNYQSDDERDSEDKGIDFPYAFLNSDELITRPDTISKEQVAELTQFLDYDQS